MERMPFFLLYKNIPSQNEQLKHAHNTTQHSLFPYSTADFNTSHSTITQLSVFISRNILF